MTVIIHHSQVILLLEIAHNDETVKEEMYPKGDFHRVYFGEILETYADDR